MSQKHAEHTTYSEIDNPDNGLAITDPNMQSVPKPAKSLPYNTFSQRQIDLASMLLDGVEPRKAAVACGYPIDNGKFAHLMGRSWIGPCKVWVAARRLADERRRMQDVLSGIASSEPGEVARLLSKPADEWTDSDMSALAGASAVEAVTTTYPDGRKVTRIKVKLADKIRAAQALDAIHRQDIQAAAPGMPSPAPARMPIPTRRKVGAARRAKKNAERKPTKAAMRESVKMAENASIAEVSDPTIAASVRALLHRPNDATLDRLDPIAQAIQAGSAQVGSGEQPQAAPHAAHRAEEAEAGPPPTADQPAAGPGPMRFATGSFHFSKEDKVQPPPMREGQGPIQHPSAQALRESRGKPSMAIDGYEVSADQSGAVDGTVMITTPLVGRLSNGEASCVVYERNEELLGPIDRSIGRGDVGVEGPILGFDRSSLTHVSEKKPVSLRELSDRTNANRETIGSAADQCGENPQDAAVSDDDEHNICYCEPMSYTEPGRQAAYMREWRKTHPLTPEQKVKDNCRSYANVYKRRGHLVPEACEVCGGPAEMHHDDYSKPLQVRWMCREHHLAHHQQEVRAAYQEVVKKHLKPEVPIVNAFTNLEDEAI